ncbi:hypothetical protein [Streptomyces sp. NPDC096351]|uniref:hypothetical protein n=1 Tax=Streptomyces sp. NPDC096351 TaxID=3366087 RepID=UPI00381F753B
MTSTDPYIETFASDVEAFLACARTHPGPATFLVDTYGADRGVATAPRVLSDVRLGPGCGIRRDSGDLGALARRARSAHHAAGLRDSFRYSSGSATGSTVSWGSSTGSRTKTTT